MYIRILGAVLCAFLSAAVAQGQVYDKFEPLKDTLARYGVLKIPEAEEYPGVPAVALLSLEEYKQEDLSHTRRTHKILKILTPAGKNYTIVKVACYESCQIRGRTIKKDGTIVPVPSKDLHRSGKFTGYRAPVSLVQFALPNVEPGDIVEYSSTVEYPFPFYLDDYLMRDVYPTLAAVFMLAHPEYHAYSYERKAGEYPITVATQSVMENRTRFHRTIFTAKNIPGIAAENLTASFSANQPAVRLIMTRKNQRDFPAFTNWYNFGTFLSDILRTPARIDQNVGQFMRQAIGQNTDPKTIVQALYQEAEKRIEISRRDWIRRGFYFQSPSEVLQAKEGSPVDFVYLLATCFRLLRWDSDLLLVNSHLRPATRKEAVFPLDLDTVLMSVRTPSGVFYLDCSRNGLPPFVISSKAMNRFTLAIPLAPETSTRTFVPPYTAQFPFQPGNKDHLELTAVLSGEVWDLDFRWTLAGEKMADAVVMSRTSGETEFRDWLMQKVEKSFLFHDLAPIEHRFQNSALIITGKGKLPRRKVNSVIDLFQNEFRKPMPNLLDNRDVTGLLPLCGEITSTYHIRFPQPLNVTLPQSFDIQANPLRYQIRFQQAKGEVTIQEEIAIRDLQVPKKNVSEFAQFFNHYQPASNWTLLASPDMPATANSSTQKIVLIAQQSEAPPQPAPKSVKNKPVPQKQTQPQAKQEEEPNCKPDQLVSIGGKLAYLNISLQIRNLTNAAMKDSGFVVFYLNDNQDVVKEQYSSALNVPAKDMRGVNFTTDIAYDIAEVYIRFQQEGKEYFCGPYVIR